MVGESGASHKNNKFHRYYKCVGVKYHRGCDKKTVKKDWIENLVIKVIKDIIFDDNLINNLADTLIEALGKESTVLPLLKKQLSDVEKSIDNIQQGIFTQSTKDRLEEFEQQKSDLSVRIIQEEMVKPPIDKDKIVFWLTRFRKFETANLEHRKRLIDSFINAIYLFGDRIIFTFNYKDGSRTITFDEIENSDLCSNLTSLGAPKKVVF